MYLMGGSIAGRRRLKTGQSATFPRGQPQIHHLVDDAVEFRS